MKSTLIKILNQIIKPSSGKFYSELEKPVPMLFQKPILMNNTVDYNYHILNKIKKYQINNTWFKKLIYWKSKKFNPDQQYQMVFLCGPKCATENYDRNNS